MKVKIFTGETLPAKMKELQQEINGWFMRNPVEVVKTNVVVEAMKEENWYTVFVFYE